MGIQCRLKDLQRKFPSYGRISSTGTECGYLGSCIRPILRYADASSEPLPAIPRLTAAHCRRTWGIQRHAATGRRSAAIDTRTIYTLSERVQNDPSTSLSLEQSGMLRLLARERLRLSASCSFKALKLNGCSFYPHGRPRRLATPAERQPSNERPRRRAIIELPPGSFRT